MASEEGSYRSKVDRLIREYELSGLGEELEHRWTRDERRDSLRVLADYFNKQLLASAVEKSEVEPLDGGIDNLYRILTEDEVSSGVQQETRNHLVQHGVNVNSVESDFVTYQAIRTYLQKFRSVETPSSQHSAESHRGSKHQTIQQLISRLSTVTTAALVELKNAGHLSLGEFEVIVNVNVHCSGCESRLTVTDLLREDGCHCDIE